MMRCRHDSWRSTARALLVALSVVLSAAPVLAQTAPPPQRLPPRAGEFRWDSAAKRALYLTVGFRDAVDAGIRHKLTRGLPTTIVMTATVYAVGQPAPVATTAQTCKVTWHVWEEAYRLEVLRPGERPQSSWTTTMEGVLRRCAEGNRLLAAGPGQVPPGAPLFVVAQVQVNPISSDVLAKIQRWVSRPMGTGTAVPGDALFSTFTGLFLQRIGSAERVVQFQTRAMVPVVPLPPPAPPPAPK
jgi:hypothetical protein